MKQRWDIFCSVIDNYGDIGVCWRLARQLASEHGKSVCLWLDDLARLHAIWPAVDPAMPTQLCNGIEIRHWAAKFPVAEPADVVIEAFACELPPGYLAAMAQRARPPVWINLEYLSAESWIEGCHGLASPHPSLPLTKFFFFPGFTEASGGLLRERDICEHRDAVQLEKNTHWWELDLIPPRANEIVTSLFCYDAAPISALLNVWWESEIPVHCYVPEGRVQQQVSAWLGKPLEPAQPIQRGNLTLQAAPFFSQTDYDRLLWLCDINFVRGEDSFVRAQWAARPLLWHIYPQADHAHQAKLSAFLDCYCETLEATAAAILRKAHQYWNDGLPFPWAEFMAHKATLDRHAARWAQALAQQQDLCSKLVIFCENRV